MHFTPTYLDVGFDDMILAEQDGPGRHDDDYHRWLAQQGLCDRLDLMDQVRVYRDLAPQSYWDSYGALTSDLDEEHHSTTWIAERALEALGDWGPEGEMLMVGFIKPHHPCDPPAPWDGMYDPALLALPADWTSSCPEPDATYGRGHFDNAAMSEQQFRQAMAYYYATVSQIDHHVGRFVDCLRRKGLYDDTLILYTSDHGDYMGCHHMMLKGGYMYDPLVKVPLIIKHPAQRNAGETSDALVSNVDLAPTILSCAGREMPPTMEGLDLLVRPEVRDVVFAEARMGTAYMARTQTHKLLLCSDERQSQFFDLVSDPLELHNRIADPSCASLVGEMRTALLRWALFDAPSRDHRDEGAPMIRGENVPMAGDGHWEASAEYFRSCMQAQATAGIPEWARLRQG
jgi:arylsulfatase A-like enzyme